MVRNDTTFGIMKFTLHATTYDWKFLPIAGSTFTDSGTGSVHGAPPAGNTAPVAVADSYSTPQNTALVQAAPGVLTNDTDADSNPLTAVLDANVTHGALTLNANGGFTYTPTSRLQRSRQLHLPRQRRHRQLEHRDRVADGQCRGRQPARLVDDGRQRQRQLGPRQPRQPDRQPDLRGRPGRPGAVAQRHQPERHACPTTTAST